MQAKLTVGFILTHNFTLTAFSTFVDVLRLAADRGDRSRPIDCAWHVMSPRRRPVKSSCGVEIQPTSDLLDPSNFHYIVVVGGLLHSIPPLPADIETYLRRTAEVDIPLVGVCTGSFVLCRLDLMRHRKCCVSWYHYRDFVEEFPELVPVADRLFVIDGNRITCAGGAGVADLAAKLVAANLGSAVARKALNILLIDGPRSEHSAQPAPAISGTSDDARVSRALLMMERNLLDPLPIKAIADELAIGVRQLERLFYARMGESPQESYMSLRLKHARWMLRNTELSAGLIAAELGFSDGSHFGRHFKAKYGATPVEFRKDARGSQASQRAGASAPDENDDRRVFD